MTLLRALRLVWQSSPWLTTGLAAMLVMSVFTATGRALAAGLVVAAIPAAAAGTVRGLPFVLALYGVVVVSDALINAAQRAQAQHLQVRVDGLIDRRAMALSLAPAGIAHIENPAHADLVKVALGPPRRTDHLLSWLPGVFQPRLVAVGMAVVLVRVAWWAPVLLLIAAWVRYRTSKLMSDSLHQSLSASAPALRRSDYFRTLAVEPSAAREVRVFGLAEWLVGRMSETWQEAMVEVWRGRRGPVLAGLGGIAAVIAAEAVVLLWIAWRAVTGHMDLAAIVTGILAALALYGVGWVGSYDHLLREALTAVKALFELERRVQTLPPRGRSSAAAERRIAGDIQFENVTFTYPGSRAPVLDGLDLRIAAGSSLAIVGANGAGKTTLIKLLTRLYEPDSGRITIGGLDLRQLEPDAWRRQMAVVFQDFIQYPLSLRDNIGSGDVVRALAQAGGGRLLEKLPGGLDTALSREFEGGVDLSGGEWQKVALARALAALGHASMLVLDEPTASLDVRSERELFARIRDPARGKTTILISHRLSSVRWADRICVLERGRVVEAGTHEELLARGGIYARMFHLQGGHFKEAASASDSLAQPADGVGDAAVPARARPPRSVRRPISLAGLTGLLAGSFRSSPRLFLLSLLLVPLSGVVGPVQTIWAKTIIEGWRLQEASTALLGAGLLAATIGAWLLIQLAGNNARNVLQERVGFAFDHQIAVLTAGIPGLAHHELPEYLDRLYVFRARARILGVLLQQLLTFFYELISFPTTLILLATVDLRLLVFVPVAAIALRIQLGSRNLLQRAQDEGAAAHRLADRLLTLATSAAAAGELRCSNRQREIMARQQTAMRAAVRPVIRAQWQMAARQGLSGSLSALTLVAAFLLAVYGGHVGPGGLFLAFLLANRAVAHISALMTAVNQVGNLLYTAERFRWLSSFASSSREAAAAATLTAPHRLRRGISIRNVRFRYPGTEGVVLEDLDLEVPAGSVLALVGENGAGKSTLVKLLCGFYTPDRGQVLVDGIDLRLIAASDWRSRISAGFQDFCRFELLAGESVAVGDVARLGDRELVASALERAGASDLPTGLPRALETQLGRRWRDGVELSTGQWQKLALGRAMMRRDPLLLFLDEPTASLDADSEFRLFERFTAAAGRAREKGGITVLVSHRFSTVRVADVIAVFGGGRIVEVGSHAELMDRDGLYAQLYRLQASGYR